jgi:hypothetical protein
MKGVSLPPEGCDKLGSWVARYIVIRSVDASRRHNIQKHRVERLRLLGRKSESVAFIYESDSVG